MEGQIRGIARCDKMLKRRCDTMLMVEYKQYIYQCLIQNSFNFSLFLKNFIIKCWEKIQASLNGLIHFFLCRIYSWNYSHN